MQQGRRIDNGSVYVRDASVPLPLSLSFWLALSMEADERAPVEWIETRRQEELAHAWDVVVHSGYVPIQTLLGTCCTDFYWPIRRRQFAWFNQVIFEDPIHVWGLVSGRNEYDEPSPSSYSNSFAARFHSQRREAEELLKCLGRRSLDHRAPRILQTLMRQFRTWKVSPQFQRSPSDPRQKGGCHTLLRRSGLLDGTQGAA